MTHVHEPWACPGCAECAGWKRIPPIPAGAVPVPPVYRCAGAGPFADCGRKVAQVDALCPRCESVAYHAERWAA